MAKRKDCSVRGCEFDIYVEGKCYRHFITEDRIKETDEPKAIVGRRNKPVANREIEQTLAAPAGTQAEKVDAKK